METYIQKGQEGTIIHLVTIMPHHADKAQLHIAAGKISLKVKFNYVTEKKVETVMIVPDMDACIYEELGNKLCIEVECAGIHTMVLIK